MLAAEILVHDCGTRTLPSDTSPSIIEVPKYKQQTAFYSAAHWHHAAGHACNITDVPGETEGVMAVTGHPTANVRQAKATSFSL